MPHTHRYTIADDEAVEVLVDKLISHGSHQQRREKLLKALDDASQHYNMSPDKERKAFGMAWPLSFGSRRIPPQRKALCSGTPCR